MAATESGEAVDENSAEPILSGWDPYKRNFPEAFTTPPNKPSLLNTKTPHAQYVSKAIYEAKSAAWALRRKDEISKNSERSHWTNDEYMHNFQIAQKKLQQTRVAAFTGTLRNRWAHEDNPHEPGGLLRKYTNEPPGEACPLVTYNIQYENGKSLAKPSIDRPMACPFRFCLRPSFKEFEAKMASENTWAHYVLDEIKGIMLTWGPDLSKQTPARNAMRRLGQAIDHAFAARTGVASTLGGAYKLHRVPGTRHKTWSQDYTYKTRNNAEIQGRLELKLTQASPIMQHAEFFVDTDTQNTINSWLQEDAALFQTYMLEIKVQSTYTGATPRTLVTTHFMSITPYDEHNVRGRFLAQSQDGPDLGFRFKTRALLEEKQLGSFSNGDWTETSFSTMHPFPETMMYEILVKCLRNCDGAPGLRPPSNAEVDDLSAAMREWANTTGLEGIPDLPKNSERAAKANVEEVFKAPPPAKIVYYSSNSLAFLVVRLDTDATAANNLRLACKLPGEWLGVLIQYPVLFWNPKGHMSIARKVYEDRKHRLANHEPSAFAMHHPRAVEAIRESRERHAQWMQEKSKFDSLDKRAKSYLNRYDPINEIKTHRTAAKVGELAQYRWRKFHPNRDDVWPVEECIPDMFYVNYVPTSHAPSVHVSDYWNNPYVIRLDRESKADLELYRRLYMLKVRFQNECSWVQEQHDLKDKTQDPKTARSFYGFRCLLPETSPSNAVKYPWGYYLLACEEAHSRWVHLWHHEMEQPIYGERWTTLAHHKEESRPGDKLVDKMRREIAEGDDDWCAYLRRDYQNDEIFTDAIRQFEPAEYDGELYESDVEYETIVQENYVARTNLQGKNFHTVIPGESEGDAPADIIIKGAELTFVRKEFTDEENMRYYIVPIGMIKRWYIKLTNRSGDYHFDTYGSRMKNIGLVVNVFLDRLDSDQEALAYHLAQFPVEEAANLQTVRDQKLWKTGFLDLLRAYFEKHEIEVSRQFREWRKDGKVVKEYYDFYSYSDSDESKLSEDDAQSDSDSQEPAGDGYTSDTDYLSSEQQDKFAEFSKRHTSWEVTYTDAQTHETALVTLNVNDLEYVRWNYWYGHKDSFPAIACIKAWGEYFVGKAKLAEEPLAFGKVVNLFLDRLGSDIKAIQESQEAFRYMGGNGEESFKRNEAFINVLGNSHNPVEILEVRLRAYFEIHEVRVLPKYRA